MGPIGIRPGSVDQSVRVLFIDNTTGLPATGLVYSSSGIGISYERNGTVTAITLATLASGTATHADGGFIHLSRGMYRLDLPDAAVASGAGQCVLTGIATGYTMIPELIWLNTQNAADVADAVLDEATSGHATSGTAGKALTDILALLDDARTEPAQGAPPVNPDLATKIDYLYKAWRNRTTQDGTTLKLYADNATTVDHKASFSYSGGTADRGEIASGP